MDLFTLTCDCCVVMDCHIIVLNLPEWVSEGTCSLPGLSFVYQPPNGVRVLLACNLVKTHSYIHSNSLSIL